LVGQGLRKTPDAWDCFHDETLGHDPLEHRRRRSIVETVLTGALAGDQLARAAGPRTRRPPITTRSVVFAVFLAVWAVAVVTVLSRQGTDGPAPLGVPNAVVARADAAAPRGARGVQRSGRRGRRHGEDGRTAA
jgi:hypothetical protein